MAADKHNAFPSKAFIDGKGVYRHDPDNQTLAEAQDKGLAGPHDMGQQRHGVRPGYCPQHSVLGCTSPDCT